ncbi:TIGR04282 family arsenosugar biosynthesis glycosyltransferase [Aurantiacibacter poecillastricola]|uniref:TIGR04282 family arsenosugar biosynthesis glycosyltransferase n=1 Tax=Aurantiacibacter poecillastricola TaxID=3064385 RepID=UPI00273EF7E6|nr:TIGR04282 family arsenosugar biosynthesis glycosyltransferase [Aurantiacibacter sp. 219JJ12-13]MDP5261100.1 TIGR04282 family arsenosugar biosynthesis glycosyltransferase [Aurantiacibacter sp. 219JJ12-13]
MTRRQGTVQRLEPHVMNPAPTIALFAKYPRAGEVKTRLAPALGEAKAAELHRMLVERTLATIRASGLPFALHYTGAEASAFAQWLGEDVPLVEQGEGDLGARLARVEAPAILLGADIPGLAPAHLNAAANALEEVPAVIGPASDGGYYLLGFREELPFLWSEMPWGGDRVLEETVARLKNHGVTFRLLEELADCDRPEDLSYWPDLVR